MVHLWQFTQIELENKTWISGSLLKGPAPQNKKASGIFSHFIQIIKSYNRSAAKNEFLQIKSSKQTTAVKTNEKGFFSVFVDKYEVNDLAIMHQNQSLDLPSSYPTYFPMNTKAVEVISDLDDTVLHSNTSSALKRIFNILFILPQNRKTILYTYQLFKQFKKEGFRISYLSKSETNLFELISSFIHYHNLPTGPLLLTQHLKWKQLAKPKKDKDHKLDRLRHMFKGMPNKKFILLGDDSQRDMEAYATIVKEYTGRIEKIFIRQTGFSRSANQERLWKELQGTEADCIYFNDSQEPDEEVDKIKSIAQ